MDPVDPQLLERANWWFDVSWYGLLVAGGATALAAAATVVFLFLQFWSSGVRERQSDWRTSSLEVQAKRADADLGRAKADIAAADARAAEATARAAEAQLALEKYKAPRVLTSDQQRRVSDKVKPFAGQPFALSIATGSEPYNLMVMIETALRNGGWLKQEPFGQISTTTNIGPVGFNTLSGVSVRVSSVKRSELAPMAQAVVDALQAEGIDTKGAFDPEIDQRPNTIHVMVGTKP